MYAWRAVVSLMEPCGGGRPSQNARVENARPNVGDGKCRQKSNMAVKALFLTSLLQYHSLIVISASIKLIKMHSFCALN